MGLAQFCKTISYVPPESDSSGGSELLQTGDEALGHLIITASKEAQRGQLPVRLTDRSGR